VVGIDCVLKWMERVWRCDDKHEWSELYGLTCEGLGICYEPFL